MNRALHRSSNIIAGAIVWLAAGIAAGEGDAAMPNSLTDAEKKEGWELLFDGKSLDSWRGFRIEGVPAGWSAKDGTIRFDPPAEGAGPRADLVTKKEYEDFELALDWAVTPGGNSGIMFRVSEDKPRTYETGAEFQVLDNAGHADGKKPVTSAGSNYALHAPVKDVTRPVGEWNEARISVEGAHVTHWLNGTKLLEYDLWSPEWKALVAASKFAAMPGYGLNKKGHVAIQDHGDAVRFRNLKIRPLGAKRQADAPDAADATVATNATGRPEVTFSRDVAPILQARCEGCHRPGQIGPMPLRSYDEARPWAKAIAQQVAAREMPPWFAHPDSKPMKGDQNLSQEEIDTVVAWVGRGAPEGDPADLPPPRQFATFAGGWVHREPDLVLRPEQAFLVGKEVDDEYRCYHVALGLEQDVWVKGVEFQPGNPAVVHHFILFQDTAGVGAKLDAAEPLPGWQCGQMDSSLATSKILEMWAPGNLAPLDQRGIAMRLDAGKDLILQIHYHNTTGADAEDWSRFAIHLAQPSETIMKEVRGQLVSAWTLDIKAGDPNAEHRASWTAPKDITLYTSGGHMHYRGKDIGMWATKPGGERETLLWMPAYDFNWQFTYEFVEPYRAPAGTVFEMVSHHDNSADNPFNPAIPPVDVKWGLETSAEMAFTGFSYTFDDEALGITPWVPQPAAGEATGGR